LNLDIEPMYCG